MFIKKLLSIAGILCFIFGIKVYAEGEISYRVTDRTIPNLEIKGKLSEGVQDTFVTVTVQKPGIDSESIPKDLSGDQWKDYFVYQTQTVLDNGEYKLECEIPFLEGTQPYELFVTVNGKRYEKPVYVYPMSVIDAFMKELDQIDEENETDERMARLTGEMAAYFSLNSGEIYEQFYEKVVSKAQISRIFLRYYAGREMEKNEDAADPYQEISDVFERSVLCAAYYDGIPGLLQDGEFLYAQRLGYTSKQDIYTAAVKDTTEAGKKRIIEEITKCKPTSLKELEEAFMQNAVWGAMGYPVSYGSGHIGALLEKNEIRAVLTEAGWDCDDYQDSNQEAVQQKYYQNPADSFYGMIQRLNELARGNQNENTNNRPGGSGGSGGGGNTGGSGYLPAAPGGGSINVVQPSGEIEPEQNPIFNDLWDVPWAEKSIMALYTMGAVDGVGDGKFAPQAAVTREQFIKMLIEAMKLPKGGGECGFEDVEADQWYTPYITAGVQAGIVQGISDNEFGVGQNITREQIAVLCARVLKLTKKDLQGTPTAVFADQEEISGYAVDDVNKMRDLKIINGDENRCFNPKSNATRAEAAHILYAMIILSE